MSRRGSVIGRPMEILLVEDDLEDAGLTIDVLRQGDAAILIVSEGHYFAARTGHTGYPAQIVAA